MYLHWNYTDICEGGGIWNEQICDDFVICWFDNNLWISVKKLIKLQQFDEQ